MRRTSLLSLVLAVFVAACADTPTESRLETGPDRTLPSFSALEAERPVQHLVVFNGKAPKDFESRVAELGGTVVLNHPIGIAIVEGLEEDVLGTFKSRVKAKYVEPNPQFHLVEPAAMTGPVPVRLANANLSAVAAPTSADDPTSALGYADQWNMRQINAEAAWAAGRLGSPDVTVAILDTGIDYMLPDLVGRVDLNRSVSFEPLDDLFAAIYYPSRHPSTDLHYHGTNVATQVSSNAWAFAGVTSRTTLMSVKVCSFLGGCGGVIQGILYAIDNGADVINMSLGGYFTKSANPGVVSAINAITNYAKQQGVTIVVAAGNEEIDLDTNSNVPVYDEFGNIIDRVHAPSLFHMYCDGTHVICVSATRLKDEPSSFTNYGRSAIDVAAPGGENGEWVYSLCPQTSLYFYCEDGYYGLGVAGTSQAAPHVAGLAALAVEDVGRSPSRVRAYIRNSADSVTGQGNSPYYGKGRINVARAVGATR